MNAADLFSPHDVRPGIPPEKVPWGPVAAFLGTAFGLGWLVCLPLWLGDGLQDPLFLVLVPLLMFTPTVAALMVTFVTVKKGARSRYLGLLPFRPIARKIWLFVLLPIGFVLWAVGSFWMATLLGWAEADWALEAQRAALPAGMELDAVLVIQLLTFPLVLLQATFFAFGEELGWRGYLTTALSPLGFWPSALISGVVWGAWHAPIILLGYNFGRTDGWGVVMMIGFCLFVGILLQWTRYWTRSVWPAALGHGALNTAAPVGLLFATPDLNPFWGSFLGIPGWILLAVIIAVLLLLRQFRPAPDWTPKPDARAAQPGFGSGRDDA
ncbi:CPBP family intramembrane glutamic endopeptidase [Microbacterium amylolyticum]|uniref:Membrane protease YdiL (CAAX protease family) n=1 Tax=Microbacterium amylolyticum TaxID=936337 RepID=A0ABS4ZKK9_9MICO|nr:CPBP family intramembrane glutamic endopeptidase [Microbacterium amylolyticum]MBP2436966.1 membrane protease YdiL (CAAX protease family) [Microbacterium amylolyticum]